MMHAIYGGLIAGIGMSLGLWLWAIYEEMKATKSQLKAYRLLTRFAEKHTIDTYAFTQSIAARMCACREDDPYRCDPCNARKALKGDV